MSISDVVGQVDGERIYKHVMRLEGVKHPIASPQKLNEVADTYFQSLSSMALPQTSRNSRFQGLTPLSGTLRA
jgi:hypothetical protein